MNFVRFTPERINASPIKMKLEQVVVRENITPMHKRELYRKMRNAMQSAGMEFSIATEGTSFAIRRDK